MAFMKFFIRLRLMCRGGSTILCHSASAGCCTFFSPTFRDFLWGQSLSSGNAKSLLGCPIHIKKQQYFKHPRCGDPSTETLPSGHHKYANQTCCFQAYSAAALGFRRFLSCEQRVRPEWMDGGFHYAATLPSDSSFEESINSRHSCGSCLIPRAFIRPSAS